MRTSLGLTFSGWSALSGVPGDDCGGKGGDIQTLGGPPHPGIVTIRDHKEYMSFYILLYHYYRVGSGVLRQTSKGIHHLILTPY